VLSNACPAHSLLLQLPSAPPGSGHSCHPAISHECPGLRLAFCARSVGDGWRKPAGARVEAVKGGQALAAGG